MDLSKPVARPQTSAWQLFKDVLDHGGQRRAHLRGCPKLTKRHVCAALGHNLSLLLRHLFGADTPNSLLKNPLMKQRREGWRQAYV